MKAWSYMKLVSLLAVGGTLMQSGCLPDNFWAGKWGEIINRSIFGVINTVLSAVSGGTITI